MSYMNKPNSQELLQSLKDHGLDKNCPSQLSDAFRLGWWAAEKELSKQRDELLEALKRAEQKIVDAYDGITRGYGEEFAKNDGDVIAIREAIANADK